MIVEKWENGENGMRYYIKDGACSYWRETAEIENKKILVEFWKKFFGKDGNKIADIYIDKQNDSILTIKCNKLNEEIVLRSEEMDRGRLVEFLRTIPPKAEYELDEQLVLIKSKNVISNSKIKIAWMNKCHRTTRDNFIKFLATSAAQEQIKHRKSGPISKYNNNGSAKSVNLSNSRIDSDSMDSSDSENRPIHRFDPIGNIKINFKSSNYIICGLTSSNVHSYKCIALVSTSQGTKIHIPIEIPKSEIDEIHPKNRILLRKLIRKYNNRPIYSQILLNHSRL